MMNFAFWCIVLVFLFIVFLLVNRYERKIKLFKSHIQAMKVDIEELKQIVEKNRLLIEKNRSNIQNIQKTQE